jgi:hypothetical protein
VQNCLYGFLNITVSKCFLSSPLIWLHVLGILLFHCFQGYSRLTGLSCHPVVGLMHLFIHRFGGFPGNIGRDFVSVFIRFILQAVKSDHAIYYWVVLRRFLDFSIRMCMEKAEKSELFKNANISVILLLCMQLKILLKHHPIINKKLQSVSRFWTGLYVRVRVPVCVCVCVCVCFCLSVCLLVCLSVSTCGWIGGSGLCSLPFSAAHRHWC